VTLAEAEACGYDDAKVCAPVGVGDEAGPDASQQRSAPSAISIDLALSATC
jgi:hypothetical protein